MAETQQQGTDKHIDADMAQGRLRVRGELSGEVGAELYATVETAISPDVKEVMVDLSAVPRMDSLGGAWLSRTAELLRQANVSLRLEGAQGQVRDFLELIRPTLETSPPSPPRRPGVLEVIGDTAFAALDEARDALALSIDMVYWGLLAPFTGKGLRWRSLLDELFGIGVQAITIVVLMNLLMGLVIALMSAAQLRQFGAGIYVADLVGIAFARELAPMMTAIIIAARSGSAITAELATMVVQEEIDALKSMGFNPVQFLIVPKLWAALLAVPALTTLAMLAGVLGGLEMGVFFLDLSPQAWIRETLAAVTVDHVLHGLFKSVVFGATIVLVGAHNGLRVQGGAQAVGQATTRAVVMDVVLLVILDMVFALLYQFVE
jgi:phospholipid/cholesterol/gamma-HCH transport system permease protein